MREILDRNRALRAFGLRNYPFGEAVVDILGKAGFLPSQDCKPVATALRAFRLKPVPESPVAIADVLDCAPTVDFSIAIDGDIGHTQIDTQYIVDIHRIGCFNSGSRAQVPVTAHKGKITFTASEGKQRLLACATHEGDGLPAVDCPDRYRRALVGQNTFIERDRSERRKRALGFLIGVIAPLLVSSPGAEAP